MTARTSFESGGKAVVATACVLGLIADFPLRGTLTSRLRYSRRIVRQAV